MFPLSVALFLVVFALLCSFLEEMIIDLER